MLSLLGVLFQLDLSYMWPVCTARRNSTPVLTTESLKMSSLQCRTRSFDDADHFPHMDNHSDTPCTEEANMNEKSNIVKNVACKKSSISSNSAYSKPSEENNYSGDILDINCNTREQEENSIDELRKPLLISSNNLDDVNECTVFPTSAKYINENLLNNNHMRRSGKGVELLNTMSQDATLDEDTRKCEKLSKIQHSDGELSAEPYFTYLHNKKNVLAKELQVIEKQTMEEVTINAIPTEEFNEIKCHAENIRTLTSSMEKLEKVQNTEEHAKEVDISLDDRRKNDSEIEKIDNLEFSLDKLHKDNVNTVCKGNLEVSVKDVSSKSQLKDCIEVPGRCSLIRIEETDEAEKT